jgi:chemotaxis signal transduction protein
VTAPGGGALPDRAVVFTVGEERFAILAAEVAEVLEEPSLSRLPGLPGHAAGVLRHRDAWIPAIDPAPALGLPPDHRRRAALLLKRGGRPVALLVDSVLGLRLLDPGRTADLASATGATAADSVRGTIYLDEDGPITRFETADLFRTPAPIGAPGGTMSDALPADRRLPVVVFRLGDARCAIEVACIAGVLEAAGDVPPGLAVRDLANLFPGAAPSAAVERRILILDVPGRPRSGLRVDAVEAVQHLHPSQLHEPPAYLNGRVHHAVRAIGDVDDRLLLLLAADAIADGHLGGDSTDPGPDGAAAAQPS